MTDDQVLLNDNDDVGADDFDPDNPESYQDIDKMMEDATGDIPQSGTPYTLAKEVAEDEKER